MNCELFQAQLLDHMYGLLEADDSLALIEHAGSCEPCRSALLRADGERKLLGAAAKLEFPGLRFQAPAADQPALKFKAPARPRTRPPIRWQRWAAAAAVLAAVTGIASSAVWYAGTHHDATLAKNTASANIAKLLDAERKMIDEQDEAIALATRNSKVLGEKIDKLKTERQAKLDAVASQKMDMVAVGAATVRKDSMFPVEVQTSNAQGAAQAAELSYTVEALGARRVVASRKGIASTGTAAFALQPDASWQPGTYELVVKAASTDGKVSELRQRLQVVGPAYATQLALDKPIYRPGETLLARSLTLDRATLRPVSDAVKVVFTLYGPQGQLVKQQTAEAQPVQHDSKEFKGLDRKPLRCIANCQVALPENLGEGEYLLEVADASARPSFKAEKRRFLVSSYQAPVLKKECTGLDHSYGPGDPVAATFHITRAGKPVAGQQVTAHLVIDDQLHDARGKPVKTHFAADQHLHTDNQGNVAVRCRLPRDIQTGNARLVIKFTDGDLAETVERPIDLVLKRMQVGFYPEGGYLVAGVRNRVYFQALTLAGKPADLKGYLVDCSGHKICNVKADRASQGASLFEFTPVLGNRYELKIEAPADIAGKFELPEARDEGVVLSVRPGVTSSCEPIEATIHSVGRERELVIAASCRGQVIACQDIKVGAVEPASVKLPAAATLGGVCRVTVYEKQEQGQRLKLVPQAERLVYRIPDRQLKLSATPTQKVARINDKATVNFTAQDEAGKPVPAIVMVGVTDRRVFDLADDRTARALRTHFLLASEVEHPEDLEHADFLLGDSPQATQALDLLLGTQGWRRFLEADKEKPGLAQADVMVAKGFTPADRAAALKQEDARLRSSYKTRISKLSAEQDETLAMQTAALTKREADGKELRRQVKEVQGDYQAAITRLEGLEQTNETLRSVALWTFGLLLLAAGLGCLLSALRGAMPHGLPIYATGLGAVGACALLVATVLFEAPPKPDAPVAVRTGAAYLTEDASLGVSNSRRANVLEALEREPTLVIPQPPPADKEGDDGKARFGQGKGEAQADAKGSSKGEGKGAGPGYAATKANASMKKSSGAMPPAKAMVPLTVPADPLTPGKGTAGNSPRPAPGAAPFSKESGGAGRAASSQSARSSSSSSSNETLSRQINRYLRPVDENLGNLMSEPAADSPKDAVERKTDKVRDERPDKSAAKSKKPAQAKSKGKAKGEKPAGKAGDDRDNFRKPKTSEAKKVDSAVNDGRERAQAMDFRSQFGATLYWQPALVLPDGKGSITFDLSSLATTFQIAVSGFTLDGRLGSTTAEVTGE